MFERLVFIEISVRANKILFDVSRPRSWCRPKPFRSSFWSGQEIHWPWKCAQRSDVEQRKVTDQIRYFVHGYGFQLCQIILMQNYKNRCKGDGTMIFTWNNFSLLTRKLLCSIDPDYFPWETGITASTRRNSQKNSGKCYRDVSEYHKPRYNNFVLTGWLVSKTVLRILTVYYRCARVTWIKSLTVFLIAGY